MTKTQAKANTPKLITIEQVKAAVDAAVHSHNDTRNLIQVACVSIIQHAFDHGDKRPAIETANAFIEALNGVNKMALIEYFCKYGGLKKVERQLANEKNAKVDIEGATKNMWWLADNGKAESQAWAGFDLVKAAAALWAQYQRQLDHAKKIGAEEKVHTHPKVEQLVKTLANVALQVTEEEEAAALTPETTTETKVA